MSTQIAVRLPDEIVAFVDEEVREHRAPSRAALVLRALERERRRRIAARDVEILSRARGEADPDEFDGLARYAAGLSSDLE